MDKKMMLGVGWRKVTVLGIFIKTCRSAVTLLKCQAALIFPRRERILAGLKGSVLCLQKRNASDIFIVELNLRREGRSQRPVRVLGI
jgi:hypothetical protein